MEPTCQGIESDSGEQASTNDDVESSQQWTTDFDDDDDDANDSDTEENGDLVIENEIDGGSTTMKHPLHLHVYNHHHRLRQARRRRRRRATADYTDSNDEEDDDDGDNGNDDDYVSDFSHPTTNKTKGAATSRNAEIDRRKMMTMASVAQQKSFDKIFQSDTETRNLLDDMGDIDDDALDLQETLVNNADLCLRSLGEANFDSSLFDLSEEQYDYYANCFLHLLGKTQGHAQIDGALSGADARVVEFFRRSRLDNVALSRIWSLADVNEDGFLNLTEFIVAMHLIVLHLKTNAMIPAILPPSVRPPMTPVRQLIRLANGNLATVSAHLNSDGVHVNDSVASSSTTTTSAASSFNSASNSAMGPSVSGGPPGGNDAKALHHHQLYYHPHSNQEQNPPRYYPHHSSHGLLQSTAHGGQTAASALSSSGFPDAMCTSLKLESLNNETPNVASNEVAFGSAFVHYSTNVPTSFAYAFAEQSTDFTDACSSTGVKQHSLSDDHLHLYAQQREITMANFSDVPPVLVDSHPMALNALSAPLALLGVARGPPPQPPTRDYLPGAKGHGRSASLDLKTFNALSPSGPSKSSYDANFLPPLQNVVADAIAGDALAQQPNLHSYHLETLSEDSAAQQLRLTRDQFAQTDSPEPGPASARTTDVFPVDYDEIFRLDSHLSTATRCEVLKRLNDELESERLKLAQIRLQLQLRIDEAEHELQLRQQQHARAKANQSAGDTSTAHGDNNALYSANSFAPLKPTAL